MEMYVTDRCRFFDTRIKAWVRGEITDISILPSDEDRTEVFITVLTSYGEFVVRGSDEHLNQIQFRITFSDFLRAAG